jgi:hypothetical protein
MDDRIRASDADRDRVAARLREHFAEGRLDQDELEERINDTLSAKTFGDLRRVMIDLPEAAPVPAPFGPGPWPGPIAGPGPMAGPGPGPGPMAGPTPYPVYRYRRRGPRLFPLLAIGVFVAFMASGGGAAAVAVKLAALTALTTVGLFLLLAYVGGRLFHRGTQDWIDGQQRPGRRHHHHHHDGWSR